MIPGHLPEFPVALQEPRATLHRIQAFSTAVSLRSSRSSPDNLGGEIDRSSRSFRFNLLKIEDVVDDVSKNLPYISPFPGTPLLPA